MLRRSPRIEDRDLMHALTHGAVGRTWLLGIKLAPQIADRIFLQRNSRISALLRAVMHQAILANVEITRPGAAPPLIRPPQRDIVLKGINAREAAFFQLLHLVVHAPFFIIQRLQLA